MQAITPSYIEAYNDGSLKDRIEKLYTILEKCALCPHKCGALRLEGEKGICLSSDKVTVSTAMPHFGEESPLVGRGGSGTIFFMNCNLRCVFCQNYNISHQSKGEEVTVERLAEFMLYLQGVGCLNINLVTPTQYAPQIISALEIAIPIGLNIPLVWNCGGYESVEVIKLLDGIVDIYMPDVKFGDSKNAMRFSQAPNYFENLQLVLKEMHRQVGDLKMDENNIATRGLLIRHLVMPGGIAKSMNILKFIARDISPHSYVNIMDQYRPAYKAFKYPNLNRRISSEEYEMVTKNSRKVGLSRGF
jgi:putative pyruvate formate lyase activating enzyme